MRRLSTTIAGVAAALTLAACSGGNYSSTPLPIPSASETESGSSSTATTIGCENATQSYDPLSSTPGAADIDDAGMADIIDRGYLIVGVSADSYLLGANNPMTGQIEGFDIDFARAIAEALFGDPNRLRLVVITAAQRIPFLQDGTVDIVARNMTMTCDRWEDIAFSAEYYRSGQKVLVSRDSDAQTLEDLAGQRVCAPGGTTSLAKLEEVGGTEVVTAGSHTGCLILFQQGQADAITGDDTVLAGLAAQDPYAKITEAEAITEEPYGIGVSADNEYLARYINAVLEELRDSGQWEDIYNRWLASSLGEAPEPPTPSYGR